MRKSTMLLGLGLALAVGADAAAAQATSRPQRPEAGAGKAHAHQEGARATRGDQGRGLRRRGGPEGALLRGITLTAEQRERVQALRKDGASQAERERFRAAHDEVRAAQQRGDTAAARARMAQLRAEGERRREQHLAALRAILTPEQQRQFDANVAEWRQRATQRGARGERGHMGRAGRGHGGRQGGRATQQR